MKKLLSHTSTKHELTCFFAKKVIEYGKWHNLAFVVPYSDKCVSHLCSSQEEADTKLGTKDATVSGATRIEIDSPDSDVFILAIRHYPQLRQNTFLLLEREWIQKYIASNCTWIVWNRKM